VENNSTSRYNAWEVARGIPSLQDFARLLDDYLNAGGKQFPDGQRVGLELRKTHRTLQRQVVAFCLGIICGISEQEYTDPRNETAIATAKKIFEMVSNGELPVGPFL